MAFFSTRPSLNRLSIAAALTVSLLGTPVVAFAQSGHMHDEGTPSASPTPWSCDMTPGMGTNPSSSSTPMAMDGMDHGAYPFDQLYIDMMIPHHESIIALAQAALPRLTDPRLIQMAENIVATQSTETEQMAAWREEWYGSAEPDMSEHSMMAMLKAMPVGTMDEMMHEMDATTQVAAFCSADNPDLAFIDQTIPHHQMAIDVSKIALEKAEHPEIKTTAKNVIAAQQAEIDELTAIRAELTGNGTATPAS
ncbi:MAG: DUF305 domain-containing protein [Thermomicrobiales bacterium]